MVSRWQHISVLVVTKKKKKKAQTKKCLRKSRATGVLDMMGHTSKCTVLTYNQTSVSITNSGQIRLESDCACCPECTPLHSRTFLKCLIHYNTTQTDMNLSYRIYLTMTFTALYTNTNFCSARHTLRLMSNIFIPWRMFCASSWFLFSQGNTQTKGTTYK